EALHTDPLTHECTKIVDQHDLFDSETNLQGLLQRLTIYGKLRNVQLLQLIDLNLLSTESAYDEKQKFETLKERLDECAAYRRSMIVYDLDSLVGINRSEGNASTGRTTNLSLINHNIYTHIKDRFQNAHVESGSISENNDTIDTDEKWSVIVIREPFLLRQFYDDIKFTRPENEIQEEEAELRLVNERNKCVQCNDFYTEKDNRMDVCIHHDGFVYDNHCPQLTKWTRRAAIEQLLKEDAEVNQPRAHVIQTPEEKERLERRKQRYKFICCDQTLQIGGMAAGCKKGKHSLPHTTHIEWENACDENTDYRAKLSSLLQSRTR
ncbi:unnamed protein product, partial [Didymodactylos carnosus]